MYTYPAGSCLTAKFEHLAWIRDCIVTKEGSVMWTFGEKDKSVIRWKFSAKQ